MPTPTSPLPSRRITAASHSRRPMSFRPISRLSRSRRRRNFTKAVALPLLGSPHRLPDRESRWPAAIRPKAKRIVDAGQQNWKGCDPGRAHRAIQSGGARDERGWGSKPRFIEVTRISPLTFRSIDVGVVLDMMIHDIDIVLQLARQQSQPQSTPSASA